MDEHGKYCDVLVEDSNYRDSTGLEKFRCFYVYADKGYSKIIGAVPGVTTCAYTLGHYSVWLDPRYDREFVRREIEAAVKINEPEAK